MSNMRALPLHLLSESADGAPPTLMGQAYLHLALLRFDEPLRLGKQRTIVRREQLEARLWLATRKHDTLHAKQLILLARLTLQYGLHEIAPLVGGFHSGDSLLGAAGGGH